jgi:AcrR family transcriptional regulator
VSISNTTTGSPAAGRASRPRDAGASRQALLESAQILFGQQGFEGTTIREIGDHAGVDAALIARYFGSKAHLYIAAVTAEDAEGMPSEYEGLAQMAEAMMTRADRRGPGPILQAIVRSDTSPEIRAAALDRLADRLAGPLVASMTAQGVDRPRLRAQVTVSALVGISLGRSLGWFDEIRSAPRDELVPVIVDTLGDQDDSDAGPDTTPRPVTYEAASTRYQGAEAEASERFTELRMREVSALSANPVLSAGSEPLTAAEQVEMLAAAEVLARYYQRHEARIHHAVQAGASWDQIAAAIGISAAQARQDYRDWAGREHVRSGQPSTYGLGLDDFEYLTALARAVEPATEREAGQ